LRRYQSGCSRSCPESGIDANIRSRLMLAKLLIPALRLRAAPAIVPRNCLRFAIRPPGEEGGANQSALSYRIHLIFYSSHLPLTRFPSCRFVSFVVVMLEITKWTSTSPITKLLSLVNYCEPLCDSSPLKIERGVPALAPSPRPVTLWI
jgi:hypothetical protein